MIRRIFLFIGLATLVGFIWHIGPSQIVHTIEHFGVVSIGIILLPLCISYFLDAYGWLLTMGPWGSRVGFFRVLAVRFAGEAINMTTPTGGMGGEPMKAYLLKQYGVPMVDGLASIVLAKTAMIVAQILFMVLGIGAMSWILGGSDYDILMAGVGLTILSFGVVMLFVIQRYGIGLGLLTIVRKLRLPIGYLESREAQLRELDNTIRKFYRERGGAFRLSVLVYFSAWTIETIEVYAILYFLGMDITLLSAFSIGAISVLIKNMGFFIPGSLGAQEGGYLFLLMAFGYDEVTGITFALIRRLREVLWIIIGLVLLALLKENPTLDSPIPASKEIPKS